jgi:ABC-2 type transport system ATP-binding protein
MPGSSHTEETAPVTRGIVETETTDGTRPEAPSAAPGGARAIAAGEDARSDAAVLAARGIEKSYRRNLWSPRSRVRVLTGAEITLEHGEVVGLVGENGSGKSTLMRILVGDLRADAGTVTRSGQVGYCPQEPLVYPRLTCDEHFELFGRAYSMPPEQERESRAAIYDSLGFERFAATRADQLSGGTLAKLNLGLALLPDPALLLLDEPYAGFDWDTYLKFWALVDERRAAGRTVLIVSHFVVDEARFDRIVEIREGRTWAR